MTRFAFAAVAPPGIRWARQQIAEVEELVWPGLVRIAGELNRSSERDIRRSIELAARCANAEVWIDSQGGLVTVADRVADDLDQLSRSVPTAAHVGSQCSSAALGPLLAVSRRTAGPSSRFHFHPTFIASAGLPARLDAVQMRRLASQIEADDRRYRMQLAMVQLPEHLRERAARFGLTIGAHEAVAYHVVDKVRR